MHLWIERKSDQTISKKKISKNSVDDKNPSIKHILTEYECKVCKKIFPTPRALRQHAQALKHKQFACSNCQQSFETRKSLRYHMRNTNHRKPIFKKTQQNNIDKKQEKISQFKTREYSSSQIHEHIFVWENVREDQGFERCIKCGKTRLEIEHNIKNSNE